MLGWPLLAFRKCFAEIQAAGMVTADWKNRVVFIPNAIRYNEPESPNVIKSWRRTFDEIPECDLKHQALENMKAFMEGLGQGFRKAFREAFAEGRSEVLEHPLPNQEQEQEQEQEKATAASPLPRRGRPHARPAAAAAASSPILEALEIWNRACVPPIRAVARPSRDHLARMGPLLEDTAFFSEWPEICRRIIASQFCRGHGKQGFVATLGWAIKPETWEKVLAGECDDANPPAPDAHRRPSSAEKAADLRDRISRFEQAGRKDIADQLRRELSELEAAHA